jgi:HPt (histidine-containing phosphotransfer) domain-containing protein
MMPINHAEISKFTDQPPVLSLQASVADAARDAVDMSVLISFEDAQIEGEPDLIVELIDLYLEDTPHRVAAMQKALATADALSLKRAAHSLKGSSANLGARRVAALCDELEHLSGNDMFQKVRALLSGLEQEFAYVQQAFAAERQRRL